MLKVVKADKNGYAARLGFKEGYRIISLGGHAVKDVLDYLYYDAEDSFEMEYENKRGDRKRAVVNKAPGQSLGLEFDDVIPMRCKNKCKFCFVDQLPRGMRETLYVKDDDYRLSCICGNYVTLTNLAEEDVERIIRLKISPLYISVHAWDPDTRKFLVTNPGTVKLNSYIERFAENGIIMHTQIVMCEGINDGKILEETVKKLYEFFPAVRSLAVVPVGLTAHREGLYPLKPITPECACATIDFVEAFNRGRDFCWCSDELYIKAGRPLPDDEYYGEYFQIENGVGLVRKFLSVVEKSVEAVTRTDKRFKVVMLTGKSFAPFLAQAAALIKEKIPFADITVFPVENNFFGPQITVSGLITGGDILKQAPRGADLYTVPSNMLKEFEDVFLDGVTLKEVEKSLGRVEKVMPFGENLVDILLK